MFKRFANSSGRRATFDPMEPSPDYRAEPYAFGLTAVLRALLDEIHSELGPGFMHMHYRRATQIELRRRGIPYEVKKEIAVRFRGRTIETRDVRLLVVDDSVLLSPIAVTTVTPLIAGRIHQYMKMLGLKLGMIADFSAPTLQIHTVRL